MQPFATHAVVCLSWTSASGLVNDLLHFIAGVFFFDRLAPSPDSDGGQNSDRPTDFGFFAPSDEELCG